MHSQGLKMWSQLYRREKSIPNFVINVLHLKGPKNAVDAVQCIIALIIAHLNVKRNIGAFTKLLAIRSEIIS